MVFSYTINGQKRLSIGEWFALEKWPHPCPADRFHMHFIVCHGSREYRCGPAPHESAAQVSALVYHAKSMRGV